MRTLKTASTEVKLLSTMAEVNEYLCGLVEEKVIVFDWETTGLEHTSVPLVLSLYQRGGLPTVIPFNTFFTEGVSLTEFVSLFNKVITKDHYFVAHNAKFDLIINKVNGIKDTTLVADTLLMVHLYNPDLEKNLEVRVKKDFQYSKETFEKICGKKWNKISWNKEGDDILDLLAGYAGEDTYWEMKLYEKYKELLTPELWKVHDKIELPLIPILRDAKIRGVKIDVPLLTNMCENAKKQLAQTQNEIYEEAGCVFNLNSPKQKQEVFFGQMNLPIISYTRTKAPSTDSNSAKEWASMGFRIGELLVKYSEINKLISGYLEAIPKLVDSENVLRGDLNSAGTATGRFSSSNPNLQNQPNNHNFPVRDAFVARPGYVFINYDYSQLELRVMAHISRDKLFIDIFEHNGDPHGDVSTRLGIPRKSAKVMNFGVLYGMGYQKFARSFGVDDEVAKKMVDDYHETYAGFAGWKVRTENYAKKHGLVKNLFGRVRRFSEVLKNPIRDKIDYGVYFGELRQSVNTIIQGSGADIVKRATISAVKALKDNNIDGHFLLQVHDELLFEVRENQMLLAEKLIKESMRTTTKLIVPLEVDGKIIRHWGEMKDESLPSLPFRALDITPILPIIL